jgi:hypothetical protein
MSCGLTKFPAALMCAVTDLRRRSLEFYGDRKDRLIALLS